jgi:tRNA-splicing ligase RtcB (3'-phosphate/5'-hydroxy nucleic acid ligase)
MQDKPITIFGDVQENAVKQLKNVMKDERAVAGALCADHHLGYSMPIGGVVAYRDAISPSGVGFDIACGNKCVRTERFKNDLLQDIAATMHAIQRNISFGLGRTNKKPIDHALFGSELWKEPEFAPLKEKAREQLGTVGSGNHYVDLLVDEEDRIWIANHFGSRGLGHTIASGFLAIAAGKTFTDRVQESEDPAVLDIGTPAGDLYVEAMWLAGQYAYAGRDYVIEQVLNILVTNSDFEVHNHHNFAWEEDGNWVVRKGATPLTKEPAFIGGSMGDISVIVRGKVDVGSIGIDLHDVSDIGALGSAPHGAGRIMSRTQAAGKLRKMWYCNNRNCDFQPERSVGSDTQYKKNRCPKCGLPLRKGRMRDTSTAAIDWPTVHEQLGQDGVYVLGSGADEAPGVYKDLATVISQHKNIEILHMLTPIGVVMAGDNVQDPYKD